MIRTRFILLTVLLWLVLSPVHALSLDFAKGKRVMYAVHATQPVELYCGCAYNGQRELVSCPVDSKTHRARLTRVEAEHMVPAADFGRQRTCWRSAPSGTSGRDHCRRTDPEFRQMEGDPHNLWPAVGALNAVRSDYRFGEVQGEPREFGACDFEISGEGRGRFIEPPDAAKGIVARAYFYMEWRYQHRIGASQRRLLEAWHRMHPPSDFERARARSIEQRTGLRNAVLNP